jgi:hypothetical protein
MFISGNGSMINVGNELTEFGVGKARHAEQELKWMAIKWR